MSSPRTARAQLPHEPRAANTAWSRSTASRSPARRSPSAASSSPASAARARATASRPSPTSNIVCLDRRLTRRHEHTRQGTRPCSTSNNELDRLGPRPLLPSLDPYGHACPRRDARPASSPAARASTSTTATASSSLDAFAGLYCVNVGYGRTEDRRRDRRAGEGARLLPRLCRPRHRGLDHARQDDHRPGARRA